MHSKCFLCWLQIALLHSSMCLELLLLQVLISLCHNTVCLYNITIQSKARYLNHPLSGYPTRMQTFKLCSVNTVSPNHGRIKRMCIPQDMRYQVALQKLP